MLNPLEPALILAPMDGVTDAPMRALQGATGSFSFSVSEFLRVSIEPLPPKVFLRDVPELCSGGCTPSGMPVQVQLLGGDPRRMAISAAVACAAGATAIDINFGCPAPTVNRHDGGASLLRSPTRIREIVRAVRDEIPAEVPLSAKLRLGWDNVEAVHENAAMSAEGGASWITIHARTKVQGYAPPVNWKIIGKVREALTIPVVANGDIWTIEDFLTCREQCGCIHYMIGRGALANPVLSYQIASELGLERQHSRGRDVLWSRLLGELVLYSSLYFGEVPKNVVLKLKQWLKLASKFGAFAHFDSIKTCSELEELLGALRELEAAELAA